MYMQHIEIILLMLNDASKQGFPFSFREAKELLSLATILLMIKVDRNFWEKAIYNG